jgi:glycosyltransferase involved in cell wall biosynthesis
MYPPKRFLGQTRGLKGHEDLIDAVAMLGRDKPPIVCVIVGGGWDGDRIYESGIRSYAAKHCGSQVIFLGPRSDVAALFPGFDAVVVPSLSENVGGAVEPLLTGIPTIATDVGGLPDLVVDGQTGWLVPPRNPGRLAAAIRNVLLHPEIARACANRGRAIAVEMFDVRRTAREVLRIYERVLGGATRRPRAA